MDAWGIGPFQHEEAHRFLAEVGDDPRAHVEAAMEGVSAKPVGSVEERITEAEAVRALAAVAVVAARMTDGATGDERADRWVSEHAFTLEPATVSIALSTVGRLREANGLVDRLAADPEALDRYRVQLDELGARLGRS